MVDARRADQKAAALAKGIKGSNARPDKGKWVAKVRGNIPGDRVVMAKAIADMNPRDQPNHPGRGNILFDRNPNRSRRSAKKRWPAKVCSTVLAN